MADVSADLKVVASELERAGHVTFGVIYDGVFVPIAQHKLGHVVNFADSPTSSSVSTDAKAKKAADAAQSKADDAADESQSDPDKPSA